MNDAADPAVTYSSYLKVDELLALQQPRSAGPEHDELLFIVIHQFRQIEFVLGAKTGGSSGAGYLRATVGNNLFPDL